MWSVGVLCWTCPPLGSKKIVLVECEHDGNWGGGGGGGGGDVVTAFCSSAE